MRRFSVYTVCILGLVVGVGIQTIVARPSRSSVRPTLAENLDTRAPTDTGAQEVAVFIGASWCAATARSPALRDSLPIVFKRLAMEATARHHKFSRIGVSLDVPPQTGLDWLSKYGSFDQVIVGGGWGNFGVVNMIWSDSASQAALPQLIIFSRRIVATSPRIVFGPVTVRERLYGPGPIMRRGLGSHPVPLATPTT
jgi:hypothetical protein